MAQLAFEMLLENVFQCLGMIGWETPLMCCKMKTIPPTMNGRSGAIRLRIRLVCCAKYVIVFK